MPSVGRVLVRLNQRCRMAEERVALLASRLGEGRGLPVTALPLQPYEEVRDFFYAHHNHIPQLDALAESLSRNWGMRTDDIAARLEQRLIETHGVRIVRIPDMGAQTDEVLRTFDPEARVLRLSVHLKAGQRAFQLATQLAYLEAGDLITQVADGGSFASEEARALSRIGLASYFAGALILPYGAFLAAAEALRYDIELLGRRFGVSFETVCHRLSTLQRPEAPGVPFFFIRVDRAGNISKRQSATDFHFSRAGGTCPLWSVYEAFAHPGRILAQLASMPDGRINLWIARSVSHPRSAYGAPASQFAIALGCDLRHAGRLVYSKGLDLKDPGAATPIGAGCKVCDRHGCAQRAFPALGRSLSIDEHVRRLAP
jgi:predicted transcriptional regulator